MGMKYNRKHPYIDQTMLLLLWSINDRLKGREGLELDPPSLFWIDDLYIAASAEQDEADKREREKDNGGFIIE